MGLGNSVAFHTFRSGCEVLARVTVYDTRTKHERLETAKQNSHRARVNISCIKESLKGLIRLHSETRTGQTSKISDILNGIFSLGEQFCGCFINCSPLGIHGKRRLNIIETLNLDMYIPLFLSVRH